MNIISYQYANKKHTRILLTFEDGSTTRLKEEDDAIAWRTAVNNPVGVASFEKANSTSHKRKLRRLIRRAKLNREQEQLEDTLDQESVDQLDLFNV